MKLRGKSIVHYIEHEGNDYERTEGQWTQVYGMSTDTILPAQNEELEALYQRSLVMGDIEYAEQTDIIMSAISNMLTQAKGHGLEIEVVWSLIDGLTEEENIPQYCAAALSEWDC